MNKTAPYSYEKLNTMHNKIIDKKNKNNTKIYEYRNIFDTTILDYLEYHFNSVIVVEINNIRLFCSSIEIHEENQEIILFLEESEGFNTPYTYINIDRIKSFKVVANE